MSALPGWMVNPISAAGIMQNFFTNYYNNVMEDAEAPTLDLGELRKEIGGIKGVGEKRLDEIMAVIERHLGV